MPAPPAPGILALEAVWALDNQPVENTFHYRFTGTATTTLLQGVCNTYLAWAATNVGFWSTITGMVKVLVRDLSSSTGITFEEAPVPGIVGHNAGTPLPNNAAIAIKRQSGHRGRGNRGRVFHFGLTEDFMQSANVMIPAIANGMRSAYDGLMTAQVADNAVHEVILHRATGTSIDVESYALTDLTVDSQRRRLPGHNRHH